MTGCGLAGLRVMHTMKFERHLQIAPLAKAVIVYTSNCVTFIIRKKNMNLLQHEEKWPFTSQGMLPPSFSWALRGLFKLLVHHRNPGIGHPTSYCAIDPFPRVYRFYQGVLTSQSLATAHQGEDMVQVHKTCPLLCSHAMRRKHVLDINTRKGLQEQIQLIHFRDNGQGADATLV